MPVAAPDIPGISGWTPLARGGFATVWQARQESLDRLVAVKVDNRTLETEAERLRFLSEAKTAGGLSGHPGIVTVHDAGILADKRPYLVMKLCPGGSLTRWQNPENRQSEERVRTVGVRIADALAAAHAQGMLHRDVKPANILIDSYGNAGLADFGLAGPIEAGSGEGITPAYAPPEVIRGEPSSEAADVYQLAATLYAVLGGSPPHGSIEPDTTLDAMVERIDQPVEPLPWVNPYLMQALLDGLANDPAARPTAAQLRDRLAAIDLDGAGTGRRRRTPLIIGLAAVATVLAVLLASAGIYLYEIDRSVTANIVRGIDLPNYPQRPVKEAEAVDTLDYVLIGTDDDPAFNDQGRSDSVMLIHLNQARDQAYVISFPRDLWLTIPGLGQNTLNAAYQNKEDAPRLVRTLESATGTRMDHVATIDFQGFVSLTKDLGGVTVNNPRAFTTPLGPFKAGPVTLEGEDALAFVRERNSLTEQERAANQRLVLKAILTKGLSAGVLANPQQFTQFAGNAAKRIQVDNGLSDAELRSTALSLRLSPHDIQLLDVPVKTAKKKGRSVEVPDHPQFEALADALRTGHMADYVAKYPGG